MKERAFQNLLQREPINNVAEIEAELRARGKDLDASAGSPTLVDPGAQSHFLDRGSQIRVRDQGTQKASRVTGLGLESVWWRCLLQLRLSLDKVLEEPGLGNLAQIARSLAEFVQAVVVDLTCSIVELKRIDYHRKNLGRKLKLTSTIAIVRGSQTEAAEIVHACGRPRIACRLSSLWSWQSK